MKDSMIFAWFDYQKNFQPLKVETETVKLENEILEFKKIHKNDRRIIMDDPFIRYYIEHQIIDVHTRSDSHVCVTLENFECGIKSNQNALWINSGHFDIWYGRFDWCDVIESVKRLHGISEVLMKHRFESGALSLESPKVVFLFDEERIPFDTVVSGRKNSNFLVEEFMLWANKTAAEVITRTYPSCALLRRHPKPNARKLRESELHILRGCASLLYKTCSSASSELENWRDHMAGNALASGPPERNSKSETQIERGNTSSNDIIFDEESIRSICDKLLLVLGDYVNMRNELMEVGQRELRCTIMNLQKELQEKDIQRERISMELVNQIKVAETNAKNYLHDLQQARAQLHDSQRQLDATNKLYMCALLRKNEVLYSDARVLGLGPKFMSIYITKLAIERRIYYDNVEGLTMEWLETTSTLVLSQSTYKRSSKKGSPGKCRTIDVVADDEWLNSGFISTVQQRGAVSSTFKTLLFKLGLVDLHQSIPT